MIALFRSIKQSKFNLIVTLMLVIFITISVFLSAKLQIWEDEYYCLDTTSGSFTRTFDHALHFESQAPLYFIVLNVWRMMSDSLFFARLLSLLFVLASCFFVYKISKLIFRNNPLLLLIIFILNPMVLWASTEARSYALCLFLTSVILFLFFSVYLKEEKNLMKRLFLSITILLAISTHYIMLFPVISLGAYLILKMEFKKLLNFIVDTIPAIIVFLLFYTLINDHINDYENMQDIVDDRLNTYLNLFIRIPKQLLIGNLGDIHWIFRVILYLVFGAILILSFAKNFRNLILVKQEVLFFILLSIMILLLFASISILFEDFVFYQKYFIVLLLPLLIIMVILIEHLIINKKLLILFLLALMSMYAISIINANENYAKRFDYLSLVNKLENNGKNKEKVVIYRNIQYEIIKLYYKGQNALIPLPHPLDTDQPYQPEYQWAFSDQFADSFYQYQLYTEKVFWLITENTHANDYQFYLDKIKKKIENDFREDTTIHILNELHLTKYQRILP